MTYVMYDSVDPSQIPASAPAVAGYVGGAWPDYSAEVRRWPHAHHLSIAVNASEDAECLDVENGDATPDEVPAWFDRQERRGVHRPCLYASISAVPTIVDVMTKHGVPRSRYRVWAAHYTYEPHIEPGCDATQWTDKALGRNLDESLCSDTFFDGMPQPSKSVVPADEARWIREFDALPKKGLTAWQKVRRRALRRRMGKRRELIWHLAADPRPQQWKVRNRYNRYIALRDRTGG